MPYSFRLPDIGEGIAEGEITRWLVKPGDVVAEDQPLVEVMTDKATVEIPSPVAGKVLELRAKEGEVVPVESVLLVIETGAPAPREAPAAHGAKAPAPANPRPEPRPAPEPRASVPARMPGDVEAPVATLAPAARRVLATPATRRLARELGIDLARIRGSGPAGRVTRGDVEGAAATPARPAAAAPPAPGAPARAPRAPEVGLRDERIPITGVRRKIAEQMRRSKSTAAHFTIVDEADVTELVALRREAAEIAKEAGVRLTYLPFILKAIVCGMRRFPRFNATVDEAKGELALHGSCNVGIATDTDRGLVVPVVKGVESKTVFDLARDLQALAEKARSGKIALEDLREGTFTVTSAGSIGTLFATPILNVPEVAILGVHKIQARPVVRDGAIVAREMIYLSLSLDHRVIDGAEGTRFLNEVIRHLERPALVFLGAP